MSKFTIKVKLQGLEIEVEGTKEDAPKLAQQIGKQLGGLLQAPAILAGGNGSAGTGVILEGDTENEESNGAGKKARKPRKTGGTRTPSENINLSHDSATYGSPLQGWTTVPKAIWFLYIVGKQANVEQLTAYSIAKNFNKYFKAAGAIDAGNVSKGLEKEKLKGQNATVGADMADGTAKYFLTQAGEALALRLAQGETINAD